MTINPNTIQMDIEFRVTLPPEDIDELRAYQRELDEEMKKLGEHMDRERANGMVDFKPYIAWEKKPTMLQIVKDCNAMFQAVLDGKFEKLYFDDSVITHGEPGPTEYRGTRTGRWSNKVPEKEPLFTKDQMDAFLESGMGGGPPLHRTHRDAICVAVNPHEYECPDCKARGTDLAKPCASPMADPA